MNAWNYIYFCHGWRSCTLANRNGQFSHFTCNLRKCPRCGAKVNRAGRWRGQVKSVEFITK
jgi:hypothetical protein